MASLTFSAAEVDGEVKLEPGDKVFYVMPPSSIPKYTPKPWPEGLDVKLDPHALIFSLMPQALLPEGRQAKPMGGQSRDRSAGIL